MVDTVPPMLSVFAIHGIEFTEEVDDQLKGGCVFCEKPDHFFVNKESGLWDCKRCGRSGNAITFMSQIIEHWKDHATAKDWEKLSEHRGLPEEALKSIGLVLNDRGFWLCPIRTYKGTMQDIRYWRYGSKMMSTKGRTLGLGGMEQLADKNRKREIVYVCEGEFDAAALRALLKAAKQTGIVLYVPGASVFKDAWVEYFMGRTVVFCYDNDNAGDDGSLKAGKKISAIAKVSYLCWPDTLEEGYDVNDFVREAIATKQVKSGWKEFTGLISRTHRRQTPGVTTAEAAPEHDGPIPTFPEVLAVFEKWLKMSPEMIDGLKICLAVALSNQIPGDPIWLFIVGPAGSGKTAMLMSMSKSESCVFKSSITPHALISGWAAKEDPSLIPQLDGKTFILKDYTEVLQMNPTAYEEVLSILRGAYDGHAAKTYGNGVVRAYDCHFSMLAGVTAAINGNSKASLGERFLKYQTIKGTGFDADHQIIAAMKNIGHEIAMGDELCAAVTPFLSQRVDVDLIRSKNFVPDWVYDRMVALAQLISVLRAQVERDAYKENILYRPQHEMGTRLAKQLIKLGMGLAIVEGKTSVDESIYSLVERVAFDTAVGFHLDLVQAIMQCSEQGLEASEANLCRVANIPSTSMRRKLDDLIMLGVVQTVTGKNKLMRGLKIHYSLTPKVVGLYKRACVGQDHVRRSIMVRRRKNESFAKKKR